MRRSSPSLDRTWGWPVHGAPWHPKAWNERNFVYFVSGILYLDIHWHTMGYPTDLHRIRFSWYHQGAPPQQRLFPAQRGYSRTHGKLLWNFRSWPQTSGVGPVKSQVKQNTQKSALRKLEEFKKFLFPASQSFQTLLFQAAACQQ